MTTAGQLLEHDLRSALERRIEIRRRRHRRALVSAVPAAAACLLAAAAVASGVTDDLQLDPTKWAVFGGGSVDNGPGAYVHAKRIEDGSPSTFLVEHDDGLPPYQAFLLHEKTLAAAQQTSAVRVRVEPGSLCSAEQVTRAEIIAMATLRQNFEAGADIDRTKERVDNAVRAAFGDAPCRGLEYAGEQARLVYAGVMPVEKLMPGAR